LAKCVRCEGAYRINMPGGFAPTASGRARRRPFSAAEFYDM